MSAGLQSEMSAIFPLGKPENNFTIEVTVKIMDKYLGTAETGFNVRVSESYSSVSGARVGYEKLDSLMLS